MLFYISIGIGLLTIAGLLWSVGSRVAKLEEEIKRARQELLLEIAVLRKKLDTREQA